MNAKLNLWYCKDSYGKFVSLFKFVRYGGLWDICECSAEFGDILHCVDKKVYKI